MTATKVSRAYSFLIIGMAVLISAALVGGGLALYDRFHSSNVRREQQEQFNERIRVVSLDYCREIEGLKAQAREAAREKYARLDETLALLNLRRTPAIEARALEDRDDTLRRNRQKPCPRPPTNPRR